MRFSKGTNGKMVAYYKNGRLVEVFWTIGKAAEYFKVSYGTMRKALEKNTKNIKFLNSRERITKMHPNTYYSHYSKEFAKYVDARRENLLFGCDECLKKKGLTISFNPKFKQIGSCDYCNENKDVSAHLINNWLRKNNILLDKRSHRVFTDLLPNPKPYVFKAPIRPKKIKKKRFPNKTMIKESEIGTKRKKESDSLKMQESSRNEAELEKEQKRQKRKDRIAGYVAAFVIWGLLGVGVMILVLGAQAIGSEMGRIYKGPEVQSVKAILLKKERTSNDVIMIYRNVDNNVWTIHNAGTFYNNAEIGDSIVVHYKEVFPKLEFMNVEKIE